MEFDAPRHIVRIDIIGVKTTHGWQVRYGKPWKFFSDHSANGTGAQQALVNAIDELNKRIATLPAPTGIRQKISTNKSSSLPSGISGPFQRLRKGRNTPSHYLQVTLPIHGGKSKNTQVYIGSENTLTEERIQLAVLKSVALRQKYIAKYQDSATQSKRAKMLASMAG
ncbi:MAG: hypothetical protein PHH59_04620 [Methylovulum sp.]|nr:hypothetical protein [Methylovulum sp.]MDD2723294.1 hypothetical protein [Methylovulum sp.]MDD5123389.1 hypothetical protein [Methylovulum sp.]